jgi:hypothetical protein
LNKHIFADNEGLFIFHSEENSSQILKMKVTGKYYLMTILLLYLMSNLFMFFNDGWFWDDWCLSSYEGLKSINEGVGFSFIVPVISWLLNLTIHPALIFHIICGIFEILGIILFFKCLSLLGIDHSNIFIITIFYALLPYFQLKLTIACFLYTVGNSLFVMAAFIFIYNRSKNNFILRLVSLICFFISFLFLPSTLVLALAFILSMAIYSMNEKNTVNWNLVKGVVNKLLNWADFVIIPFVFWLFKAYFLKPTGVYAESGYREFSVNSVIKTPFNLILAFIQNFIGLGVSTNPVSQSEIFSILFFFIFILLLFALKRFKIENLTQNKWFLIIGLFLFFAAVFPYSMVGLVPQFDGYNSRHQILLKFGSAFILFYIFGIIKSGYTQKAILAAVFSLFIVATLSRQLQFQKSWFKQLALEKGFAGEKLLEDGVNFVIIDNTKDYNEYNINYAFYCYTGILNKTFGTQTRFAVDSKALIELENIDTERLIKTPFFHMKDCRDIKDFKYTLTINPGKVLLSNPQSFKMLYQYYFDKSGFENSLSKILSLHLEPYNSWD